MKLFWEDQKNIYNLAYIVCYLHQNLQLLMMIYVQWRKLGLDRLYFLVVVASEIIEVTFEHTVVLIKILPVNCQEKPSISLIMKQLCYANGCYENSGESRMG